MDRNDGRRVPLSVLYGVLGLMFVWAIATIVPMTGSVVDSVFRPKTTIATPFYVDWPDGALQVVARDLDQRSDPPLRRGDRVVSFEGEPFSAGWKISQRVATEGPSGTLHVVVARRGADGVEEQFASVVALRSVAAGKGSFTFRVLIAILGLLMPWVCFLVGFWVALIRPRDPMAWLVLFMLLGFQVGAQRPSFDTWPPVLRVSGAVYGAVFGGTWPLTFPLFGVYIALRLEWERRFGWIKWLILAPVAVFAAAGVVVTIAESLELRAWVPMVRMILAAAPFGQFFGIVAVTLFFLVVRWKSGMTQNADGRRRLRLLLWGGCVALLPVLGLIVVTRFLGRPLESVPVGVIFSFLVFMPVFPFTLAYVILVERAMDVRVAVRQGLRYAVTRGAIRAIRAIVVLFMAAVLWNAWNLVNDPTANRPRKLQAIAWGMAAALLVPRFAKRAFDWTDRRFFREAYDVERVLTDLSEQVRTIAETGPLLDTVLDRIGTTLHVDRLAVFLHEGDRLVPSRSRGFDPPPTVWFPAASDMLARLRESGRPLRVRFDDPESPLRRETISEADRLLLAAVDAELVLPLNGKSNILGAITLASACNGARRRPRRRRTVRSEERRPRAGRRLGRLFRRDQRDDERQRRRVGRNAACNRMRCGLPVRCEDVDRHALRRRRRLRGGSDAA